MCSLSRSPPLLAQQAIAVRSNFDFALHTSFNCCCSWKYSQPSEFENEMRIIPSAPLSCPRSHAWPRARICSASGNAFRPASVSSYCRFTTSNSFSPFISSRLSIWRRTVCRVLRNSCTACERFSVFANFENDLIISKSNGLVVVFTTIKIQ